MGASPLIPNLLYQIQAALGAVVSPSLNTASAGSDIFEAYVLSVMIEAAQREGATISYRNVDGSSSNVFTFRTSPGHIWWDGEPYTHAEIQFQDAPMLEAHTGVYISGKSGLIHEADVLVLLGEEADFSREYEVPPRSKRTIIAAECKFYASNLKLGLGRAFVGLCSDLSTRECFFVTNGTSTSVEKLLTHQRKNWQSRVEPVETVVVERLRNSLQDTFKDFKTKYAP